jgi:hypothetical protein
MDNNPQQVGPLKKVSLTLFIGRSGTSIDNANPRHMEFIFGTGIGGLTDFECMLAGKHVGDEIFLSCNKSDTYHQFAHLYKDLPGFPADTDQIVLRAVVENVSEPTHREIVRSLAESASCGSDCGCGCGSH